MTHNLRLRYAPQSRLIPKRKRTVKETPVDVSKLHLLKNQALRLQDELEEVDGVERDMGKILLHLSRLESTLAATQKTVRVLRSTWAG